MIALCIRYQNIFGKSADCSGSPCIVLCIQRIRVNTLSHGKICHILSYLHGTGNSFVAELAADIYFMPGIRAIGKNCNICSANT